MDVCIIGAGPAGLMAAIYAARSGAQVCILERNSSAGRKLLLTGGGRCNLTHAGDIEDFVRACQPYGHSLKRAFYTLPPRDLVEFFAQRGLATTTESDGCIFPCTGRAPQVCRILVDEAKKQGVVLRYGRRVICIAKAPAAFDVQTEKERFLCKCLVAATGGVSWPKTGSTGDGYALAKTFGHTIRQPVGILCPVVCLEPWPGTLQGVSLEQVSIRIRLEGKTSTVSGALVFTEDGIGGPAAFDVSRVVADEVRCGTSSAALELDLCPNRPQATLDAELLRLCAEHPKKELSGALAFWLPRHIGGLLQQMVCGQEAIPAGQLRKEHRRRLAGLLKAMPLTVVRCGDLEKATVTRGGVCRGEINFKTMGSRLCEGLYFAGEVIDADGPCGGYNLQIAFSTGALAGLHAAEYVHAK
ncbi:MAG: NAD(P)/FAD-dependent oxidoreductase [Planctomycetales bacterium]|nr:NAD(P)/FAD-dependent oxidoreductase [Planctomycetales bacterium]